MAILNANLGGYKTATGYDPLPPGEYTVRVHDAQVAQSRQGNQMLKIMFVVDGPTHEGRKLFEQFVLGLDVAMSRLKALATAGGHANPDYIRDSDELIGLRLVVKVKLEDDPIYGPTNRISSFKKPINAAPDSPPRQAAPPTAPTSAAPPKASAPSGPLPWSK